MSAGTASEQAAPSPRPQWEGLAYLVVVYFVWGSTYLGIRVAVSPGSGFPPFWMGATRILAAGLILVGWLLLRRQQLRVTRRELGVLAASGLLLWTGGNGMVTWAEQRADSGYAALLVGTTPIWVALMGALLDRRLPSRTLMLALLVGFGGVAVLSWPMVQDANRAEVLAIIALIIAPISWGAGSILQSRRPVSAPTLTTSAYQHLFGALGYFVLVMISHEPFPSPTPQAWAAWLYLIFVGSLIGFTAFLQTIKLLPLNIAMTYGYVNPVVAVALGWFVLSEPITPYTIVGSALVLLGVAGVFRDRYGRRA